MSDINELVEQEVERRLNDPVYLREANLRLTETIKKRDLEIEDKNKEIETKDIALKALAPIKDFYNRITISDDWMEMSAAVKTLAYKGYGRNNTFKLLKNRQILRYNNEPYQKYIEMGLFKIVEEVFELPYGETEIYRKTVVSQKGLDYIRKIIESEMVA